MIAHAEIFKDVTRGLHILLSGEFKLPVFFDQGFNLRRSMYFSVEPVSSNIVELRGNSQVREYVLTIKHYWHRGVKNFGARSNHQKIMNTVNKIIERMKQLLTNNESYTVDNTVDFGEYSVAFGSENKQFVFPKFALTTTWSQDPTIHANATRLFRSYVFFRDTKWFGGKVLSVDYEPPRNESENRSDLIMTSVSYSTLIEDVVT